MTINRPFLNRRSGTRGLSTNGLVAVAVAVALSTVSALPAASQDALAPGSLAVQFMPANPGLPALAEAAVAAAAEVAKTDSLLAWVQPLVVASAAAAEAVAPGTKMPVGPAAAALAWMDDVRREKEVLASASFDEALQRGLGLRESASILAALPPDPDATTRESWLPDAQALLTQWCSPTANANAMIVQSLLLQWRPATAVALAPMPTFGDLPTAIDTFLAAHGTPPLSPADRAAASSVAEPTASALVRIVEAALFMHLTTQTAFATGAPDLGLLMAARDMAAIQLAASIPMLTPGDDRLDLPPIISITTSTTDDVYSGDYALLVDLGGNDTYRNNAGAGGTFDTDPPGIRHSALLIDKTGDDQYLGRVGLSAVNGAGHFGTGFLWDDTGNDTYLGAAPDLAANGAGQAGLGTLVDGGGEDLYQADVGSGTANGAGFTGAGALIDAGGDDRYLSTSEYVLAANGAGYLGGFGHLVDGGGNDLYDATAGVEGSLNGAGFLAATGWLLDACGDDQYLGSVGEAGTVNGAGWAASGHLLDYGGSDIYDADLGRGAANGAGLLGRGLLADRDGFDHYLAAFRGRAAANGAGDRGSGLLIDGGGDDHYNVTADGPGYGNGGAYIGAGLLIEIAGNDVYNGSIESYGGLNGGSHLGGVGCLLEMGGDDHYNGTIAGAGGINGATRSGTSVLIDGQGNDTYDGTVGFLGGVNAAATIGFALLEDRGGTNVFRGSAPQGHVQGGASSEPLLPSTPATARRAPDSMLSGPRARGTPDDPSDLAPETIPAGAQPSVAILLSGPGNDTFVGGGVTQGAGDFYGIGILVDAGGVNNYSLTSGIGQGAGRAFGLGLLLDGGSKTGFSLGPNTQGQGAGLQGVGLLARSAIGGMTNYHADPTSQPSANTGGGASLLLDQTTGTADGTEPDLTCAADLLYDVTQASERLIVCGPSKTRQEDIRDPTTGEPLGPQNKPPVSCDIACRTTVEPLTGPDGPAWLERDYVNATTGGGVVRIEGRGTSISVTIVHAATLDDSCDTTCPIIRTASCVLYLNERAISCIGDRSARVFAPN